MESIMEELSTEDSFDKATEKLINVLERLENKSTALSSLQKDFKLLSELSLVNNDQEYGSHWSKVKMTINLVKKILKPSLEFNK